MHPRPQGVRRGKENRTTSFKPHIRAIVHTNDAVNVPYSKITAQPGLDLSLLSSAHHCATLGDNLPAFGLRSPQLYHVGAISTCGDAKTLKWDKPRGDLGKTTHDSTGENDFWSVATPLLRPPGVLPADLEPAWHSHPSQVRRAQSLFP